MLCHLSSLSQTLGDLTTFSGIAGCMNGVFWLVAALPVEDWGSWGWKRCRLIWESIGGSGTAWEDRSSCCENLEWKEKKSWGVHPEIVCLCLMVELKQVIDTRRYSCRYEQEYLWEDLQCLYTYGSLFSFTFPSATYLPLQVLKARSSSFLLYNLSDRQRSSTDFSPHHPRVHHIS